METGTKSTLKDIWGLSMTSLFAVGLDGTALHYNGTKWESLTTTTNTYFNAVWGIADNDLYAVAQPVFKANEAIYHYDGKNWTLMNPPRQMMPYYAVWASSATDVFIVGEADIYHYDGSKP